MEGGDRKKSQNVLEKIVGTSPNNISPGLLASRPESRFLSELVPRDARRLFAVHTALCGYDNVRAMIQPVSIVMPFTLLWVSLRLVECVAVDSQFIA